MVLVAGVLFFFSYNFQIFENPCGNEILSESTNPNGLTKAVIFQRDCGATTGFSTQVSILKSKEDLKNKGGNIFVADTNHGEAPSGIGGGPKVDVEWLSQNELKIFYHPKARTYTKSSSLNGIQIIYEEIEK